MEGKTDRMVTNDKRRRPADPHNPAKPAGGDHDSKKREDRRAQAQTK